MLLVEFRASLSSGATVAHVLEIGRVRSGPLSDYTVVERGSDGAVLAQDDLLEYPRWAEHSAGLAARAGELLWRERWPSTELPAPGGTHLLSAAIDIGLGSQIRGMGRTFEFMDYASYGTTPHLSVARDHWPVYDVSNFNGISPDTRTALVHLLSLAAWGTTSIPLKPAVLAPPVHKGAWAPVVRFADIPEPARTHFNKWMEYKTVPAIPELGDCAYAWDWSRFLGGV